MEEIMKNEIYEAFSNMMKAHFTKIHLLLNKIDLYPGQHKLLFFLKENDGLSQKDLSKKLNITPATVNVMVRRMEKQNILERRKDQNDQRIIRVFLTKKGYDLISKSQEAIKTIENEMFEGFSLEEKLLLKRFFNHIEENLTRREENDKTI
jgi:DNA-binding MarR family transcriptional regulator